MREELDNIYDILSQRDKLDLNEYQRLITIYGEDNVRQVIEYLILEDEENIYKFGICYSQILESFGDISDLKNYDIYLSDVREVACLDSDKNMELMREAFRLIQEMEEIFKEIGCDDTILGNNKIPWLFDKIDYCLKKCRDINLLNKLNNLYHDYCKVRDIIVSGNLRLVIRLANEYSDDRTLIDDMIQEGNKGLIRAVEKFDINKDVTFNTYAGYWILQGMTRGIKAIKYPMRLPINKFYECSMIMDTKNDLSLQLGRTVTDTEVSEFMNIPLKKMQELLFCFQNPVFLDEMVESDFDDREFSLGELIADGRVDVYNDAVNFEYRNQLLDFLDHFLKESEYLVLKLYFGLGVDGVSFTEPEIAKMLGVTQQRVGQIKNCALRKLRRKPSVRDIVIV